LRKTFEELYDASKFETEETLYKKLKDIITPLRYKSYTSMTIHTLEGIACCYPNTNKWNWRSNITEFFDNSKKVWYSYLINKQDKNIQLLTDNGRI
jgi:hypothetical protein